MQPHSYNPWIWRDPPIATGAVVPPGDSAVDDADADVLASEGLAGYAVEAADGHIGSVDKASYEVDAGHLVVDTGPWIFGRKVLLPAGTVDRIDRIERKVYVGRTKEQIKDSPEYDKDSFESTEYREQVGTYYAESHRDPA
jgi:hypothetical protein